MTATLRWPILFGFALACSLVLGRGLGQPAPQVSSSAQPPLAAATVDEVARGKQLFLAQCGHCHGPRGEGGRGPALARPRLPHAPDDAALLLVIRGGIPGTQMPSASMSTRQTWQVAAYVRSLGNVAPVPISGDAVRGRALYAGKGNCARCHTIAGHGGGVGPDLTDVGARTGVPHLRAMLLDPEAVTSPNFLQVRLATRDGRRLTGVRVNEDAFSIQIRDLSNNFHSFWKRELTALDKDQGKSLMPRYRDVFTTAELEDMVAYLVSLQGGL